MASPKKYLLVAKIESTQFTDSTPVPALDAMLVSNLNVTPLRIESQSRDVQRAYLGNSEKIPVLIEGAIEFDVEVAGSGAAGTAPGWGVLMRACGMAETIVASTSVAYNPISAGYEFLTIKCYRDGIKYTMTGAAGSWKVDFTAKQIPHFHYTFLGKYVAVADATIPSGAVYTLFQQPKAAIPANEGTLTIGGYAAKVSALSLDMAVQVSHAIWINQETIGITDRAPVGSITAEMVTVATNDYFSDIQASTLLAFTMTHGTVAGNKVTLAAPKVQLVDFKETVFENTLAFTSGLTVNPDAGNDELIVTAL